MFIFQSTIKVSRFVHFLLILSFILPFFKTGCNSEKATEEVTDNKVGDSSELIDSLTLKSDVEESSSAIKLDTTQKEFNNENMYESVSRNLALKSRIFKMLLYPEENTFTGLGAVVDRTPYITFFALNLAFLLLFSSFITKCFMPQIDIQLVFYEGIALFFLIIAYDWYWLISLLIGYKICCFLAILLFGYDIFQLVKSRKNNA